MDDPNSGTGYWTGGTEEPSVAPPVASGGDSDEPPPPILDWYTKTEANAIFVNDGEFGQMILANTGIAIGVLVFGSLLTMAAYYASEIKKKQQTGTRRVYMRGEVLQVPTAQQTQVSTTQGSGIIRVGFHLGRGQQGQQGRNGRVR